MPEPCGCSRRGSDMICLVSAGKLAADEAGANRTSLCMAEGCFWADGGVVLRDVVEDRRCVVG